MIVSSLTQRIWGLAILVIVFVLPIEASASPFTISVDPAAPEPKNPITLTLRSYVIDVNASYIVWVVNDQKMAEGSGLTTYKTVAPELGTMLSIEALILTPDKQSLKETLKIRPGTVDVLWQAETYVPPFYRGKALPTDSSMIHATAIADFGAETDPRSANFSWVMDISKHIGDGTGIASALFRASEKGGRRNVSVLAKGADGIARAASSAIVPTIEPEIVFYASSPLRGVLYDNAFRNKLSADESEQSLHSAPYYFSSNDRSGGRLSYEWWVDEQQVYLTSGSNEDITILASGASAERRLALSIINKNRVLQRAGADLRIEFTGGASPNGN